MESSFAFFILFSLVLFATSTIDARKDTGEYWRGIMKDQPMPEAIQGLVYKDSVLPLSNKKPDCHTPSEARKNDHIVKHAKEQPFVKDFEPSATVNPYDTKLTAFVKDFEPKPSASVHRDDVKLTEDKSFVKDFEPRPNVLVYHGDLELRPNALAYDDDAGLKEEKSFVKDFEPRPNALAYDDDAGLKEEK